MPPVGQQRTQWKLFDQYRDARRVCGSHLAVAADGVTP
jgi:hypothetical protein